MNKRKKGLCQLLACIMVLVMLVSLSPVNVQAASKVKINKTKTTMYVGTPKTLKITGTTKKVTWKSSNKKIATVSAKGKVTPKKAGTVVITAKVSGKNYKCKVTVKKPCLSATKKTVKAGSTYKLVLHGTNVKKCSSTNKSIATVKKNDMDLTAAGYSMDDIIIHTSSCHGGCSYYFYPVEVTKTVHHDATYKDQEVTVTDKEGYWEVTGYKCSLCGATKKEHQHNWAAVKHEAKVKPAWRETVYTTETHVVCKKCGYDFTAAGYGDEYEFIAAHCIDVCDGSNYGTKRVDVTKTIDHPEEIIEAAYTSYKCTTCGATKR
ncbi:MAG: Ig-like domain-containing protein [Clostridium sp.]|nr:Ig-like domain-containing protein [Clostridium sp.]